MGAVWLQWALIVLHVYPIGPCPFLRPVQRPSRWWWWRLFLCPLAPRCESVPDVPAESASSELLPVPMRRWYYLSVQKIAASLVAQQRKGFNVCGGTAASTVPSLLLTAYCYEMKSASPVAGCCGSPRHTLLVGHQAVAPVVMVGMGVAFADPEGLPMSWWGEGTGLLLLQVSAGKKSSQAGTGRNCCWWIGYIPGIRWNWCCCCCCCHCQFLGCPAPPKPPDCANFASKWWPVLFGAILT